jgi:predicted Zn-dependent protease
MRPIVFAVISVATAWTEYEALIKFKPDYLAARPALVNIDVRLHKRAEAIAQLQEVVKLEPRSAEVYERLGDGSKAAGRSAGAVAAALDNSTDKSARNRIQKKARV